MRMPDYFEIYGANIKGTSYGYENYSAAVKAFRDHYDEKRVNHEPSCVKWHWDSKTWEFGHDEGYHVFLVREDMMSQILQNCTFELTKKKGMGRAEPKDWIKEQVAAGKELWFTLRFFPSYD
jgi:hypothetical protein